MPRKKAAQVIPPPDMEEFEDEFEIEPEEVETGSNRSGLDIYDENGNLISEGEPTYIEEDEEIESED
jgi:hypothetical protein